LETATGFVRIAGQLAVFSMIGVIAINDLEHSELSMVQISGWLGMSVQRESLVLD
jgi:hypothetical protein